MKKSENKPPKLEKNQNVQWISNKELTACVKNILISHLQRQSTMEVSSVILSYDILRRKCHHLKLPLIAYWITEIESLSTAATSVTMMLV